MWNLTTTRAESFSFKTIDDILEENSNLKDTNFRQKREIAQLSDVIQNSLLPIGSIIAWVSKPSDRTDPRLTESLPRGWVRCSGILITEGKWKGQYTPDINNAKKFLRGGPDTSEREMEDWAMVDHHHTAYAHPHSHSYNDEYVNAKNKNKNKNKILANGHHTKTEGTRETSKTTGEAGATVSVQGVDNLASKNLDNESRPTNMKVIYIMRVF